MNRTPSPRPRALVAPKMVQQAVALSLQRAWRGKQGREKAARLRAIGMRRVGAAITAQKAYVKFTSGLNPPLPPPPVNPEGAR